MSFTISFFIKMIYLPNMKRGNGDGGYIFVYFLKEIMLGKLSLYICVLLCVIDEPKLSYVHFGCVCCWFDQILLELLDLLFDGLLCRVCMCLFTILFVLFYVYMFIMLMNWLLSVGSCFVVECLVLFSVGNILPNPRMLSHNISVYHVCSPII